VMVIRRGRLVANASVAELTGAAAGGTALRSADDASLSERLRAAGAEVTPGEGHLVVGGIAPEEVGHLALDAGIAIYELRPAVAELEDVFMELTAGGGIS